MKTVGVVLSGCGYLDGAEIYESVLTLLALDREGAAYQCLAPDVDQMHVINHITGQETGAKRSVLIESSRIARGHIKPLDESWADKLNAVIFPGGFGAAKNHCDYAVRGNDCAILPQVQDLLVKMIKSGKPVGVICIAPVMLARAVKDMGIHAKLTVGGSSGAADSVNAFGGEHVVCPVTDCVVDAKNRIVSTPAYMYDAKISEVAQGIEKLVKEIVKMM